MKKRFTQSVKNGAALVCAALLLAVCAGGLKAQNLPHHLRHGPLHRGRDPLPRLGHLRFAIAVE